VSGTGAAPSVPAPVVGAPAPAFDLETPEGERVRLADLRGKVVILNFWATWCGPCRLEMPDLEARAVADPDRLATVGINFDETAAQVQAFRDEVGVTFPLVLDPGGKVQRAYRVLGYPTTFFVDEEGIIRIQHVGLMSASQIDAYLEEMGWEL
jgi:cytochrome c biogenesis protein CcmG, thiol:disulfide interchange protein DsbE